MRTPDGKLVQNPLAPKFQEVKKKIDKRYQDDASRGDPTLCMQTYTNTYTHTHSEGQVIGRSSSKGKVIGKSSRHTIIEAQNNTQA